MARAAPQGTRSQRKACLKEKEGRDGPQQSRFKVSFKSSVFKRYIHSLYISLHSWRCTLRIFLYSQTCLLSHFMDSKEMPRQLPKLTPETSGRSRMLNLGLSWFKPPTTGPCHLKLSLQQRAGIIKTQRKCCSKDGKQISVREKFISQSQPQSFLTTGKNHSWQNHRQKLIWNWCLQNSPCLIL